MDKQDTIVDWEALAKRYIALSAQGVRIEFDSGHYWLMADEDADSSLDALLKDAGVRVNGKIYGGILEALDTIDEALQQANAKNLLTYYNDLVTGVYPGYSLGNNGIGHVDRVAPGQGGIL